MSGKKTPSSFCDAILDIKTIILPRQARDKHRKNSKRERRFLIAWSPRWTARPTVCRRLSPRLQVPAPANISVKRLKHRLSGSARKSQKRFRDTPTFKLSAVFVGIQPFQRSNERSEWGDHPVWLSGSHTNIGRSRYADRCATRLLHRLARWLRLRLE
jgi:hypothetical protein